MCQEYTAIAPVVSFMPNRHQIRNAIRKYARTTRKAGKVYMTDAVKAVATSLVAPTDAVYTQVRDRVYKLFEVSKLFNRDDFCGDRRLELVAGAKL